MAKKLKSTYRELLFGKKPIDSKANLIINNKYEIAQIEARATRINLKSESQADKGLDQVGG